MIHLILVDLIFVSTASLFAAEEGVPEVRAYRIAEKFTIDGFLDESLYQAAPSTDLFLQFEPDNLKPCTQQTNVWVGFDNEFLYIGAMMFDTRPDSIFNRLTRRDETSLNGLSDEFDVYIDAFHDHRNGQMFCVTAGGALRDGFFDNDALRFDQSWDGVWDAGVKLLDNGWSVEIRIPFSQIRFDPDNLEMWGINFERDITRRHELAFTRTRPRNGSGFTSLFAHLVGLDGNIKPRKFEFLPYAVFRAEFLDHTAGDPFNTGKGFNGSGGLDLKYGVNANWKVTATLNPDFGQVEVDPNVINLTDQETYYPEKRPFFTEDANTYLYARTGTTANVNMFWATPVIFHSRRIGRAPQGMIPTADYYEKILGTRILGAVKLSGTAGGWKIATLQTMTNREMAEIQNEGIQTAVETEPLTYYGVARAVRQNAKGTGGIGILGTYADRFFKDLALKDQLNSESLVGGIDGFQFLDQNKKYVISGYASLSHVRGTEQRMIALQRNSMHYFQQPDLEFIRVDSTLTSMTGFSGRLFFSKEKGNVILNASLGCIGPRYEINDLGILPGFTNLIGAHVSFGYRWLTPTRYYRSVSVSASPSLKWDFDGNVTSRGLLFIGSLTLPNFWSLSLTNGLLATSFNTRLTRGGPITRNPESFSVNASASTDSRRMCMLTLNGSVSGGMAQNSGLLGVNVSLKLSSRFRMNISPSYQVARNYAQWVGSYADLSAQQTFGRRYVFGSLNQKTLNTTIRLDWILTPKLSIQLYAQPLFASGDYQDLKYLNTPKTYDFTTYGSSGSVISETTDANGSTVYILDSDGTGPASQYRVKNPDFRITTLRGNAVLRWEYAPGSTLYLVWTQQSADQLANGDFEVFESISRLVEAKPNNIFMVKLSYWFDR